MSRALVIFGGTGDLSYRKLYPAMYNLFCTEKLDDDFEIIGIGRRDYDDEKYHEIIREWTEKFSRLEYTAEKFDRFKNRISYYRLDLNDIDNYRELEKYFDRKNIVSRIYYLAVAPEFFIPVTKGLETFDKKDDYSKVIIEKPFGKDLESAAHLNAVLREVFDEDRIYHIDHYLGKEMIQNITSIRFKNAIFKGIWSRDFIESIHINSGETVGVESRAGYYDKSGALKDMVQNHLFQLMSYVTMEPPAENTSEALHRAQLDVFKSLKKPSVDDIANLMVLAQYNGYREENGVDPDSRTETFASLKLFIDNERWDGVPIIITTGKKLEKRISEVVIDFKSEDGAPKNRLVIKIQPDEGIDLNFNIKKPGTEDIIETVSMDFCQSCILENRRNTPEAYERLLKACMDSDRSLFSQWEQIVESWSYINFMNSMYRSIVGKIYEYEIGSNGPEEMKKLEENHNI